MRDDPASAVLRRAFAASLTNSQNRPSKCVNHRPALVTAATAGRIREYHTMTALQDIVVVLDNSAPCAQQHGAARGNVDVGIAPQRV
jgi:hypothetical protein